MSASAKSSAPIRRFLLCVLVLLTAPVFAAPAPAIRSAALSTPLYFEAAGNGGPAQFIARGRRCDVALSSAEAVILLGKPAGDAGHSALRTVRLTLREANAGAALTGLEPLAARANYFIGNEPSGWRIGVPLFARVAVNDIYPGTRLVYYADASARLEYDFILAPGASPDRIAFRVEGVDRLALNDGGDLVLQIGGEEIRQHRPVIYQVVDGVRREVRGGYRLSGDGTVGFRIEAYDHSLPLVIDPTLDFLTYLGGSKADLGWGIARDGAGNIYIAGETLSKTLPGTNGVFQPRYAGGIGQFGDAFVAKYETVSNSLVYLTYLGGKSDDGALAIAVDSGTGKAFVTGFTDSRNFPLVNALRTVIGGNSNNSFRIPPVDAFVTGLDPSGSAILFSTYLGGTRRDSGRGIAVDGSGVYVIGFTESTNFFPITPGAVQPVSGGSADVFVTKLDQNGGLIYSTYLGGSNYDSGESIAVESGNAFITGSTTSPDFPIANPIVVNGVTLDHLNGRTNGAALLDAFVAELPSNGQPPLIYSTFLGGSNHDAGLHIAVDSGTAYVTGYTLSRDFPTNTATLPGSPTNFTQHVFVTAIGAGGGASVPYSIQFGGSFSDQGTGIAIDPSSGDAYVTGFSSSTNIFTTNVLNFTDFRVGNTNAAGKKIRLTNRNNAFITVVNPTGTALTNSVLLGGSGDDQAHGIALDTSNPANIVAYIVGQTTSPNLPIVNLAQPGLVQTNLGNVKNSKVTDAFVGRIEIAP